MLNPLSFRRLPTGWSSESVGLRLRAAGVHLLICIVVAVAVVGFAILKWFPSPFLVASGGGSILAIVIAVDLVIGPLLTFLVFDRRKPELRRDLSIIAALQIAALAFGIHTAMLARPVFLTFVVDRFEVVSAAEVDAAELGLAPPQFQGVSGAGPKLAAARRPDDPKERELLMLAGASGIDLRHLLRHYVPYESLQAEAARRSKKLEELKQFNDAARVDRMLAPFLAKRDATSVKWLPIQAKRRDLVALVDASQGDLIALVDLRPW